MGFLVNGFLTFVGITLTFFGAYGSTSLWVFFTDGAFKFFLFLGATFLVWTMFDDFFFFKKGISSTTSSSGSSTGVSSSGSSNGASSSG